MYKRRLCKREVLFIATVVTTGVLFVEMVLSLLKVWR